MTAYSPDNRATNQAEIERDTVKNLPRRDAADKLRGRTRYTIDRVRPDMLHAVLLRSPLPSGRIVKLGLAPALAMPGVRGVATYADFERLAAHCGLRLVEAFGIRNGRRITFAPGLLASEAVFCVQRA